MTQIDEKVLEAAAKAVFECHCFNPDKHPWVKGGNSFKQQDARRIAVAAIEAGRAALPPTGDGLREAIDDCEEARKQRDIRDRFLVQRGLWGEFCKWLSDELPPVSAEARIAELEREMDEALWLCEQRAHLTKVLSLKANEQSARAERLEAALREATPKFIDADLGDDCEYERCRDAYSDCSGELDRIKKLIDAALSPAPSEGEPVQRDWREDQEHENGNFINRCSKCEEMFFGHKRRVICKACTSPIPSEGGDDGRRSVLARTR